MKKRWEQVSRSCSNTTWKKVRINQFNRKLALLVFIASIILTACTAESGGSNQAEQENDQKAEESTENNKDKNAGVTKKEKPSSQSNEAVHAESAQVARVVDGDTIKVTVNGKEETVRMLLVDTPETKHPSKPVQPFGPEASSFAKNKLSGKQVELEYDGPKYDKYERLLAYVWVDGKMFNQLLLEEGLARLAYVYDPPYTHFKEYMKAQNRAKTAEMGIWSKDGYVRDEGFYYQNKSVSNGSSSSSEKNTADSAGSGLLYDPNGPDRDCSDFDTQQQAQDFFEAAGGPANDPHRLDGNDNDGKVCETLP